MLAAKHSGQLVAMNRRSVIHSDKFYGLIAIGGSKEHQAEIIEQCTASYYLQPCFQTRNTRSSVFCNGNWHRRMSFFEWRGWRLLSNCNCGSLLRRTREQWNSTLNRDYHYVNEFLNRFPLLSCSNKCNRKILIDCFVSRFMMISMSFVEGRDCLNDGGGGRKYLLMEMKICGYVGRIMLK